MIAQSARDYGTYYLKFQIQKLLFVRSHHGISCNLCLPMRMGMNLGDLDLNTVSLLVDPCDIHRHHMDHPEVPQRRVVCSHVPAVL